MKIFCIYLAFQAAMSCFGLTTALMAPVFFLYVYWRAKKECQ